MVRVSDHTKVIINALETTGVMPVLSHTTADHWPRCIALAYRQGIRVLEFAHTRDHRSLRLFHHLIRLCESYPGLIVGAGTVINAQSASAYLQAGAAFIASPFLYHDMGGLCHRVGAAWIPGCTTTHDIAQAQQAGAATVSILGGTAYELNLLLNFIRSQDGPYFIPSNGLQVSGNNISPWIDAGALCIRMLLPIFPKEATAGKNWMMVEQNLSSAMALVKNRRKIIHGTQQGCEQIL